MCREAGDRVLVLLAGLPVTLSCASSQASAPGVWRGLADHSFPQVAGWAGGPSVLSFIYSADIFELPLYARYHSRNGF